MKKLLIIPVILSICMFYPTGCSTHTPKPKPKPEEEVKQQEEQQENLTKEDIIRMQEEIIKLRQRILDDTQIKMDNGQGTLLDLADAKQKLADAKIKLDEFQDRPDLVVQELQGLFQFYVTTRGEMVEQLDTGKGKAKELYEIEIGLMETNIRLSEAILKIKQQ